MDASLEMAGDAAGYGGAPATSTGRWTEAEHAAFEEGLRRAGTNWR
jgi:hypothetical protein